ncbi:unnamed protein product [Prorocentrum cordatum]|uniref:Ricin B lectin domain-containing protein n=1 Tax=Prorocentrum cordatum TaxID=2364126 RepID=A0ABN9VXN2_9DINO|nr:unnamed protein product [Polarella glacialis]
MARVVYEPTAAAAANLEAPATDLETLSEDADVDRTVRVPVGRLLLGCTAAAGMLACVSVLTDSHRRGLVGNRSPDGGDAISKLSVDPEVEDRTVWIKSKEHDNMCLSVTGGENKNGVPAQIDFCDSKDTSMQFLVPKSSTGSIKWYTHSVKCLHSSGGELMWWDCDADKVDQQVFSIPEGSSGHIELASSSSCMAVPTGGGDTTGFLEMGDCQSVNADFIVEDIPGICTYSEWSDWSACTDKCGGGVSARSRAVVAHQESDDGDECDGRFETRRCKAQKCEAAA